MSLYVKYMRTCTMQDITLKFFSTQDLWKFKSKINVASLEINLPNKTLIGRFSKEEIEIAVLEFKAYVKDKPPTF